MTKIDTCFPLKSYEDVLNWKCDDSCWAEKVSKINKRIKYCYSNSRKEQPNRKLCPDNVPKTLICHDMKGGYLEDRFVNDTESEDPYRFYNWWAIDLFVYFSHYFVTIPPVGWINASHLHGVPILGTVITENELGVKLCSNILESKEQIKVFTIKLAEICQHYGFDGYLLNIENKVDNNLMNNLVDFVKLLKDDLKATCRGRETWIIWYDSVITPSGELKWQNKLNQHNKIFFDACDGIFLNYCWKEEDLKESLECAGSRLKDVYVGIDVFGRNCYGGGGFNSHKALEVIRNFGLSAAIFAPGWTHEMQSKKNGDDFISREHKFWRNLWSLQYTYGPSTMPFRTTFCQGFGLKKYKEGDICSEVPWFNLRKQNYQPLWFTCMHLHNVIEETSPCISLYTEDAYEGGSCLKLSSCNKNNKIRLFFCDFTGQDGDSMFYITMAYRFLQDNGQFKLELLAEQKDNLDDTIGSKTSVQATNDRVTLSLVGFKESDQAKLCLDVITDRNKDHLNSWQERTFKLSHGGDMSLREIVVETSDNCSVLLGLLNIATEI